jgi:crotonobetainyl-CoA:carnitine CoA-transferase CaiB-like acyl-CoA transferase
MENYDAMRPPIDRAFRSKSSAEWIAILNGAGVANGAVRDIGQMLNDPQLAARRMVETLMHPTVGATKVIGAPIKLSENEASVRTPPPVLGQHTDAVLTEVGYDAGTIASLRQKRVI